VGADSSGALNPGNNSHDIRISDGDSNVVGAPGRVRIESGAPAFRLRLSGFTDDLVTAIQITGRARPNTVENTTSITLPQVRVEVHLSNGIELGPTTPVDLAPGQKINITLPASSSSFVTWSAHPEVVGSNGNGDGEHSGGG
jgi:hypothetical protein